MKESGKFCIIFSCILSLLLLSGSVLQAQSKKLTFGIHAGPVFSNQWSTEEAPEGYEKPAGEVGLTLGIYINFSLGKRFSLQGEAGWIEKGAKHNLLIEGFPFGPVDITYSTEYIEFPLWVKFYVIKKDKFRIYTGAGGYTAFFLKGQYLFENEFVPTFTEDLEDMKKSDFGFLFNWGLELKLGGFLVHLEYRYSMGFYDIGFPTGPGAPPINLRHLAYVVLFGVSF